MMDWNKAFEEQAAKAGATDTPEQRRRIAEKSAADFERGVRLGWHDKDGNPIPQPDDSDDEGADE
ncbi:hypothetical protein RCSAXON_29 [Rhodobacter phage RcSaxon]|uniref:Uncharacterized protein n=1 Tax=Rhodobacter phage RcSaxon TaxID=1698423 RepID=A0A0K1Y6H9_9CAUD|nr:hypothetical protein RCSAXON_29 [Rhodobacter phage RcSaxon]